MMRNTRKSTMKRYRGRSGKDARPAHCRGEAGMPPLHASRQQTRLTWRPRAEVRHLPRPLVLALALGALPSGEALAAFPAAFAAATTAVVAGLAEIA
eukprot:16431149-Heterocapsa_arctica.AAC.1